jgi:hypothetical protein
MQQIRLAVCGLSAFADDIVKALVDDVPFVELVTSLPPSDNLGLNFVRSKADVMVCALSENEMERVWRTALAERPPLAMLNLVDDHSRARLHALYPHRHTIEELDEEKLVRVLRRHLHMCAGG